MTRLLFILVASCIQVPLDDRACPCAAGWQCCADSNICVRDGTVCPEPPLKVTPSSLTTTTLRVEQFTAEEPVTWSVEESGGGRIDGNGQYLPPVTPGEYHVLARAGSHQTRIPVEVKPLTLELFAGAIGGSGDADGVGADARFRGASALAADGRGGLYIADTYNYSIRRLDLATNEVTTFAGTGRFGTNDGDRSTAGFFLPSALAVDGNGLYVGETRKLRRIDLDSGEVTTVAGNDNSVAGEDGVGAAASFYVIGALVSDGAGVLYAGDTQLNTIRRIDTASGEVSTLAGQNGANEVLDGVGAAAHFRSIHGIAYDPAGFLYVADDAFVRKIEIATGNVTTLSVSGQLSAFKGPRGLVFQTNSDGVPFLFVAELQWNYAVNLTTNKVYYAGLEPLAGIPDTYFGTPAGLAAIGPEKFAVLWGGTIQSFWYHRQGNSFTFGTAMLAGAHPQTGDVGGTGAGARFWHPVALAPKDGKIFVADYDNALVRSVDVASRSVSTLASLGKPMALTALAGKLLVGENGSVPRMIDTATGALEPGPWSSGGCSDGTGSMAQLGMAITMASTAGVAWIADLNCKALRRFDFQSGELTTPAKLSLSITGIVEADGPVYLSESSGLPVDPETPGRYSGRLLRVDNGTVEVVAGGTDLDAQPTIGFADGERAASRLTVPAGLARDAVGRIYVADSGNGAIRRYNPATGRLETLAGTGRHGVHFGEAPSLNLPVSLALATNGELIIADMAENSLLLLH